MKYRAFRDNSRRSPIRLMCRVLAVSSAGYYAWRDRPESARGAANRVLIADIRVLHRESRRPTGVRASGRRSCSGGIRSARTVSPG